MRSPLFAFGQLTHSYAASKNIASMPWLKQEFSDRPSTRTVETTVSVRANPSMKRGGLRRNWEGEQRGRRTTASAASKLCGSGAGGDGVRSERVEPGSVQQAARHTAQDAGTLRNALSEAEGGWQRNRGAGRR